MLKFIQEAFQKYPNQINLLVFIMALVLSRLPYLGKVLRIINTLVHETGHALMALFLSGEVVKIDLFSDTSGMATTKSKNRFSSFLISFSGYPFASFTSWVCFYFYSSNSDLIPLIVFITLSAINLVFWVRNWYGITWLVAFLAVSVALIYYKEMNLIRLFSFFMGCILLIDSFVSAVYVCYMSFINPKSAGDAENLRQQTYIPAFFWGLFFLAQSLFFSYLIWKFYF